MWVLSLSKTVSHTHTIHVWCIYLHLVDFYGFHGSVNKNVRPMDSMGQESVTLY